MLLTRSKCCAVAWFPKIAGLNRAKKRQKTLPPHEAFKFNSLEAEKNIPDGLWIYDSLGSNNVKNLFCARQTRSTAVIHSQDFSTPQLIAAQTLGFTVRSTRYTPADTFLLTPLNKSFRKPISRDGIGVFNGIFAVLNRIFRS